MQNINRHVWKLLAAVGVALMAYAWADDSFSRRGQPELFGLGAGAVTVAVLFLRDPPGGTASR
jgi:hypothetical protein